MPAEVLGEVDPQPEPQPNATTVSLGVGMLTCSISSPEEPLETVARTALGLIGKLAGTYPRHHTGFDAQAPAHTDLRPQPDYSWQGALWGEEDDRGATDR